MYVALENSLSPSLFGLVHAMGFANALYSLGLPQNSYLTSLIMLNVGVDPGKLAVLMADDWTVERLFF